MKLNEIFSVTYGNKFDLNKMRESQRGKINFVGRTAKNNGVVARVEKVGDTNPYPAGLITVALGGSILSSFVQTREFYTAQNVAVLSPHETMSTSELLYYCTCLEANRFKYSAFGREANVTLSELEVPSRDEVPVQYKNFNISEYTHELLSKVSENDCVTNYDEENELVKLSTLFELVNGLSTTGLKIEKQRGYGYDIPILRPSYKQSTSISGYVSRSKVSGEKIFPKETLYVSTNGQGSHTFSYVSPFEFTANSDVTILLPKRDMNLKEKLFYSMIITKNRYKFSYGRKPKGDKLKNLVIPKYPPKKFLDISIEAIINNFTNCVNEI